jgi:hypothetical protein
MFAIGKKVSDNAYLQPGRSRADYDSPAQLNSADLTDYP